MKGNTLAYIVIVLMLLVFGVIMVKEFTKDDNKETVYDPYYSDILIDASKDAANTQTKTEPSGENKTEGSSENVTQKPTNQPTSSQSGQTTGTTTQAPTQKPTEPTTQAPTQKPTEAPTQPPSSSTGQYIVSGDYEIVTTDSNKAAISAYCGSANTIVIPEIIEGYTITGIRFMAFDGTSNKFTSITIPKTVTYIEAGAIVAAEKIVVASGNTAYKIGPSDFLYTIDEKTLVAGINYSRNSISSKTEKIGAYAFYGCKGTSQVNPGITYMDLPESLKVIEKYAYAGCLNMKKITIPTNVTSLENNAFYGCGALIEVGFLNKSTTIASFAFTGCNNIKTIYGYTGSTAETYAKQNGITFKLIQ